MSGVDVWRQKRVWRGGREGREKIIYWKSALWNLLEKPIAEVLYLNPANLTAAAEVVVWGWEGNVREVGSTSLGCSHIRLHIPEWAI